ncbi:hypothetical protein [Pontibacter saemangeumensis]
MMEFLFKPKSHVTKEAYIQYTYTTSDITKSNATMSTRAATQQKKQRQKEFKERKENEERLKAAAKKAKQGIARNDEEDDRMHEAVLS